MLPTRIGHFNENSSKLVPNYVFLTVQRVWARQGELRADASVCGCYSSSPLPPNLCVSQHDGKDREKEQSRQLNSFLLRTPTGPKMPQKVGGWKVVGLYEVGVHSLLPLKLSGKRWRGILGSKPPRGNKCVLTSTLLSSRWFISSDDSNANSNRGILPRPLPPPTERLQMWRLGGWGIIKFHQNAIGTFPSIILRWR